MQSITLEKFTQILNFSVFLLRGSHGGCPSFFFDLTLIDRLWFFSNDLCRTTKPRPLFAITGCKPIAMPHGAADLKRIMSKDIPLKKKLTRFDLQKMKQEGKRAVWMTAYDYMTAFRVKM